MESNVTKILIKKFWKRCVTLPWIAHMRYGPPFLVLTFTDDPPRWGPSPPPPKKKRTFPKLKASSKRRVQNIKIVFIREIAMWLTSLCCLCLLFWLRGGTSDFFFHKSYIFTCVNCFVTLKTVVVGSIFLLSEIVVTTPDESKAWK